ncbi:hypothetical protein KJ782_06895 [Patescibacteria group bacterium]|nr:hypothetical protein [Patescibacteria group bacterium]
MKAVCDYDSNLRYIVGYGQEYHDEEKTYFVIDRFIGRCISKRFNDKKEAIKTAVEMNQIEKKRLCL